MKRTTIFCFILFLMVIFPACLCAGAENIYSIDIPDVNQKEVMDYIVNDMISDGYSIVTINDYQLVFKRKLESVMASVMYGSKFNTTPELRASFNIAQVRQTVKVVVETQIITNPNSGFEKSTPAHHESWQKYLNSFIGTVEYGLAFEEKKKDKCFVIAKITKNSTAEQQGLNVGDLITKVNEKAVSQMSFKKFNKYFDGTEGSSLTLTIKTPEGEKEIVLTKIFIPGPFYKKEQSIEEGVD